MTLEQLDKAIREERQSRGLTGRLEDLIEQRRKLLRGQIMIYLFIFLAGFVVGCAVEAIYDMVTDESED